MSDTLVRGLSKESNVRGVACVTTDLVREACRRHGAFPTAAVALGRALTAAALMEAQLKEGQRVALKFEGNGPLKKIIAEAESDGSVRGYVAEPEVELPRMDGGVRVAPALGRAGLLTVTKDLGLRDPYRGTVQLYTSEIAADLAYYLTESEQIPSAVSIGVFLGPLGEVAAAGGFMVQSLPPSDERVIATMAERIEAMPPASELILGGTSAEGLLTALFDGLPFAVLGTQPLTYRCSCSRERVEQALVSLGAETVRSLVEQGEAAEVRCEFCRQRYAVDPGALERILTEAH